MKSKQIFRAYIIVITLIISVVLAFTSMGKELNYTGLSLDQAQSLAIKNGTTLRAVNIDGEPQITTKDYRVGRINASLVDGIVTEYYVEGEK